MIAPLTQLDGQLNDSRELFAMAEMEDDAATLLAIEADTQQAAAIIEGLEFRRMFSGPMDQANCFIDIQAGAGGTEACDWASMLLRQYLRYCER